jgi:hypothetical protein
VAHAAIAFVRRAPAEHQTPGMLYAAELDAHASNGDP